MTTERMTDDLWQRLVRDEYPEDSHERIVAESERARRVEQEQAEKMRALEGKLVLVMGERDAAETKAAHLEARLKVAHETISFANDKMAEQVRQARWEVADTALSTTASGMARYQYLSSVRDANAPKD